MTDETDGEGVRLSRARRALDAAIEVVEKNEPLSRSEKALMLERLQYARGGVTDLLVDKGIEEPVVLTYLNTNP